MTAQEFISQIVFLIVHEKPKCITALLRAYHPSELKIICFIFGILSTSPYTTEYKTIVGRPEGNNLASEEGFCFTQFIKTQAIKLDLVFSFFPYVLDACGTASVL
jgi:hypothetical protein